MSRPILQPALKRVFPLLLTIIALAAPALATDTEKAPAATEAATGCPSCLEFDRLNTLVRDGKIDRSRAKEQLIALRPLLKDYYHQQGGKDFPEAEWVFPLKGYDARAIDGGKTHGYVKGDYDYFAGNRHKGHPSFDIFIHDKNQDQRDDRSGGYVPVLSLTGGVVVARETAWDTGSPLRGGKYLWIYDPASDALVYYAHNRELFVAVGGIVRPGSLIASVGRSGLNAYKRRSPTHLHLTLLKIGNGGLLPMNIYLQLTRARLVRE